MPDDDFFEIPAGTPVRSNNGGTFQLKVDGEWIDLSTDVTATFDLVAPGDPFLKGAESLGFIKQAGCQERCRCGIWQCLGEDPHKPRFGPFHVYPAHPCADLADPKAALDLAAEEDLPEKPNDYDPYWK